MKTRLKLLIAIDWFLPAYKAGGPIQSIANLTSRLKNEFDISVITSNLDLGEPIDIDSKALNVWIEKDGYRVIYMDAAHQNKRFYRKLFDENTYDIVYFNSMFSIKFTLLPFFILRNKPIRKVLATRGMLGKGALGIKPFKKYIFLKLFKSFNFHKKLIWHATAESEVDEIKTHFGTDIEILLAPNLSKVTKKSIPYKIKTENQIHIFFLSRISIKKNLLGALNFLSKIEMEYNIRLSIIGPIDEKAYWQKCLIKIKALPQNVTVNYVGSIPNHELSERLKEEHVLLLPTFHENFGHVIMESWQNGCPVLISDQTPWRNLKNDKLGYDISINNESAFCDAIKHFSTMTQFEYAEWSTSAFDFAQKFIENPKVLEQNKALFLGVSKK